MVAWVLLQLFNNLEPILKLPEWAGTLVVGGFPLALIFAWTLELKAAPANSDGPSLRVKSAVVKFALPLVEARLADPMLAA